MSDNDKVIKFPGAKLPAEIPQADEYAAGAGHPTITPDQEKAIATVLSGLPFVCIGIRPTHDGADFITSCAGDPTDLRNAQEHLPGVILRLFERKGIL